MAEGLVQRLRVHVVHTCSTTGLLGGKRGTEGDTQVSMDAHGGSLGSAPALAAFCPFPEPERLAPLSDWPLQRECA